MPHSTYAQLGAAIRKLRKARTLSIEALAAGADLHTVTVSRIERGKQEPKWESVVGLATALDVDLGDIARLAAKLPPPDPEGSAPPDQ